ncbi:MAG: hypothetical protein AAGA48_32050 [Myxococcota bacterium]
MEWRPRIEQPRRYRLSELDEDWATRTNPRGETPEIDFACSEPFPALSNAACDEVLAIIEAHRSRCFVSARSASLRGVPSLQAAFGSEATSSLVTSVVGEPLKVHPMRLEHAHVNLQVPGRPVVDGWHTDYVPFVIVVMLRRSPGDGGALRVEGGPRFMLEPGQAIVMQGSHVRHQAEAAERSRTTLVISLVPASLSRWDTTWVHRDQLPYSPEEPLHEQFEAYRLENVTRLEAQIAKADDGSREALQARLDRETAHIVACRAHGAEGQR